ncbi:MAG: M2 family metallopeptidase [Bacteroidota bacterium]
MAKDFASFLESYEARVAPLLKEANEAYWAATTTGRPEDEARAAEKTAAIRKLHADAEEYAQLKRWRAEGGITDPILARQLTLLINAYTEQQIPPAKIEEIARREQEIESRFTNFRPVYEDKPVSENDLREILVYENDSAKRRAAWEASKRIGAEVAPLLLQLVEERNKIARDLGFPDFYLMRLGLDQLEEKELFAVLDDLKRRSDAPFAAAKAELDAELARRFGVPADALRPWHYADPFFQESPPTEAVDIDRFFVDKDPVALTGAFFAGLGLPVDDVIARSDLFERPKKNQHAYCMDVDRLGDVRVLANVRPNEQWMSTMLHEFGHAAYSKYHDPGLPFLLRDAAHTFTTEAIAMMMGRLTKSADWLHRQAGVDADEARAAAAALAKQLRLGELIFIRWGLVMVYFEREMYRDPAQNLNALWWRLVRELQLVTPPEGRDAPDYASKIHLGTVPVYYHNYILGTLAASQIKAALAARGTMGEGMAGDRAAGDFLRARIFAVGAKYHWNEMLRRATGEGLTAKYFVREFVG